MKKRRVGIDLAPASRLKEAPGTAMHVHDQTVALMKLDVPWEWAPVAESSTNPLLDVTAKWNPSILPGRSTWRRATFSLGSEWRRRECDLGFATSYFIPWMGIPTVANFFDAGVLSEKYRQTWITSGKALNFYLIKMLNLHCIWKAKRLFIDSEYWSQLLQQHFPSTKEKIVVTPCGIRPPHSPVDVVPSWVPVPDEPYFLNVGVFSDNKNQRRLIELWSQLQKEYSDCPRLILVGPNGSEYYRNAIAPLLKTAPRPEEIIIPGLVSNEDLAWSYQHALAYLQPSYMEGFGLPIAEAMSYGIPVACSDTTSLPETAGKAGLLFSPDDLSSIRRVVLSLWKDESLRQRLSMQGLERSKLFTWENNARIVAAGIDQVLSNLG